MNRMNPSGDSLSSCESYESYESLWRQGYMLEYSRPLHVRPLPGTFVLFPSWLMHRVRRHTLPAPRVSVSFNMWVAEEGGGIDAVQRLLDGLFELA